MGYSFNDNLTFGTEKENIAVNYLCREMGFEFIGGDVNGKIVGSSRIEQICKCSYVPIKEFKYGSRLEFKDENGNTVIVTMPDKLLKKKSTLKLRWMEVKSTRNPLGAVLEISKKRIDNYNKVEYYSGVPVFIVMAENALEGWGCINLKFTTPKEVMECNPPSFEDLGDEYRIDFRYLPSINKKPISADDYK